MDNVTLLLDIFDINHEEIKETIKEELGDRFNTGDLYNLISSMDDAKERLPERLDEIIALQRLIHNIIVMRGI